MLVIIDRKKLLLIPIDCKFCPPCRGGVENSKFNWELFLWVKDWTKDQINGYSFETTNTLIVDSNYSANFLLSKKWIAPVCSWELSGQEQCVVFMKNKENHGEKNLILLINHLEYCVALVWWCLCARQLGKNSGFHCYTNMLSAVTSRPFLYLS